MNQENKIDRNCPLCLSAEKSFLYKQNFNNRVISLMDGYNVVSCQKCGFAYADDIPSQAEFDNYYAVMSKYEFNYKDGVVSDDYIDYFTKIFDFLNPHLRDKNVNIMDIGCATGGLLSIFKANGYVNLSGIDPSPSCVKAVKELYGIKATVNNISDFVTDEKFDLIVLSAVLEHLVDFDSLLPKIRTLLKDEGLLFVEIPDAERFVSYITSPFQQFSVEHINYFSRYSIKNLLSKFAFELIKAEQRDHKLGAVTDPDLFVLCKKSEKHGRQIVKDEVSEIKIKEYIAKCSEIDLEIKKIIKEKLAGRDKIIVWGTGTHTLRLINAGLDMSKILYFVDSNARYAGKKLNGIEIKLPGDIKEQEIPIFISTFSYQEEIARQIREKLKLNNEIIKIYT